MSLLFYLLCAMQGDQIDEESVIWWFTVTDYYS